MPRRPRYAVLLSVLVAVAAGGCASLRPILLKTGVATEAFTEAELRAALAEYDARFTAIVASAAAEIAESSASRKVRRRTLLWRIRVVPILREAAFDDDAQEAYVGVLTVAVAMRQYFTEGDGRDVFEDQQALAVRTASTLEEDAVAIGRRFLTDAQLSTLRERVEELGRASPIRGRDFAVEGVRVGIARVGDSPSFAWIVDLPMLPYRTIEGISSTALAIHDFNRTARAFTDIVASLPQHNRWQLELLLYDFEDRDTVVQGLAAFERLAASVERASAAVERLPADARALADEARPAIREANEALATAREVAALLGPVAAQLHGASDAWAGILAPVPGAEPGRPFDVREWESAAARLAAAAAEIRGLAVDLRALLESPRWAPLAEEMGAPVARARVEAAGLVDLVAWRAAQVIAFFFACLVVYRIVANVVGRRARPST